MIGRPFYQQWWCPITTWEFCIPTVLLLLAKKIFALEKYRKIGLKERAEIVVVRRFLTYECGCGPHCAVRTAPHTTVRVVVKPNEIWQILGISLVQWVERKPLFLKSVPITIRKIKLSKCDVCEKTFRLQISLVQHMRSVHLISKFSQTKEKYYKCRYCTYQTYR